MDEISFNQEICSICKNILEKERPNPTITNKGADRINEASRRRGDSIVVEPGWKVHKDCRKDYTFERYIQDVEKSKCESSKSIKRTTREAKGSFDSINNCLFCGTIISNKEGKNSSVMTKIFTQSILQHCNDRKDDWSSAVRGRIEYYGQDLVAADSQYHHKCDSNFRKNCDIPLEFQNDPKAKHKRSGRPKDEARGKAFSKLCAYIESMDEEQVTVSDLRDKMNDFLLGIDADAYDSQYLKKKLKIHYGEDIHFSEQKGLSDIVILSEKTSDILRKYKDLNDIGTDIEAHKKALIETAAKLIKSDIKNNIPSETSLYPSTQALEFESAINYIPNCLKLMLNTICVGEDNNKKVASIGQAIVQAARPRSLLVPLQVGLAVQMHHLTRSKFILDTLHVMGFCASYREVLRFEKNAANCVAADMLGECIDLSSTALLFAADNVDHNIITLDGKGTFHGMGMTAAFTPGKRRKKIISRLKTANLNIVERTKIDIKELRFTNHVCRSIKFIGLPANTTFGMDVDIFWELSLTYKQAVPNWQGMMHTIYQDKVHPGKSSVLYLPMIDMYPGDKSCILSTLEFLCNLALKENITPIITFDQPLYWKAAEIILDSPENGNLNRTVLMLGSFHTFMNLLGAIGKLMEGTGLKGILEVVYGENAVLHMMTGKSVQRSFRGHLLVEKCLNQLLVSDLNNDDLDIASQVDQVEKMYNLLVVGDMQLEIILNSDTVKDIKDKLEMKKQELEKRSKTSQLWLNYKKMLQIARQLITADRTGSWKLHLSAVTACLPIFASAGHYNYLKSAYLYIQQMSELQIKHPDVFTKFEEGFHVIRRSNTFWAGLGSDLVIEQTLMRSLKSTGGLTHGSGMSEEQISLWTMSVHITSEYNCAMQEFSGLCYTTSEQHKDSTEPRIQRDTSDLIKIMEKLVYFTPFSPDPSLRNIITGVVAEDDVNANDYKYVGDKIIEKMKEQPVFSYSFKRKDKAKTLGEVSTIKITMDQTMDPTLLFQRSLVVSQQGDLGLKIIISYELWPFPPSLFEAMYLLRKADKPQLSNAIIDYCNTITNEAIQKLIPNVDQYILDGGSLLHRLQWRIGDTYVAIAQSYAEFTINHYGKATVIFDGYEGGPSIKDNTHRRRRKNTNPVIIFTAETEFTGKKDDFLSRDCNKQRLINLISDELKKVGCKVIQSNGDADVDIVKAAVKVANVHSTALVGEDTDLLVLLLYHVDSRCKDLYFYSDNKSKETKVYHINHVKQLLGFDICSQLLFVHAFTGCDSTSRIFGIGKKPVFQKLLDNNPILESCANLFVSPSEQCDTIKSLGKQAMAVIFGGNPDDTLESLRYNLFSKKVAVAKSFVTPERLPPTSSSTEFHCLRVYYQIMVWIGEENNLDPLDWGWKLEDKQLIPVMTQKKVAPEKLLKMIHCNCTTACSTRRCSCRGYGLPCTSACGSCQLNSCENPIKVDYDIDE